MTDSSSTKYAGSDWLKPEYVGRDELSDFEKRVADLLGEWQRGIYHISDEVEKGEWSARMVEIRYGGTLSTFDFDELTRLVFLAHDLCIRVEISPRANRYFTMRFHPRKRGAAGDASMFERHPTLEQAVEAWRQA